MRGHRLPALVVALLALTALAPTAAQAATPEPFGRDCQAQNGVRFCAGPKVPSFDGAPIDAEVTLPPSGDGPWPTIVMLHGYGGSKNDYVATSPEGKGSATFHWNNVWFAQNGYAVLNTTARGFGESCGRGQRTPSSPDFAACAQKGYIHLKDQRWEAHDTQHLLGLLADQGVARPDAIGTTGISYGGGESIELAYLRDRTRNAVTNELEPWVSPAKKIPLRISAAWARWPWSDLVSSLLPNGRFLDFDPATGDDAASPIGVPIQSYIAGLYALGQTNGFYAPPGFDPTADITNWFTRVNSGEPYDEPTAQGIVDEIRSFHQGFGIPGTPAPLLLQSGWTDDLFPPRESLRVYNDLRAKDPSAQVSLQFGDLGHSRGSNKTNVDAAFNDQGSAFFARHLKSTTPAGAPAAGSVTTFTQTCPREAPGAGPFTAGSWPAIHPGAVVLTAPASQTVSSAGGDPQTAAAFNPIAQTGGTSDACRRTGAKDDPGTALAKLEVTSPFTLMGLTTIRADIAVTGTFPILAGRLWDVAPDGQQTLVERGVLRLTGSGPVVFQLQGNGYRFEAGHTVKLELLGRDAPYFRASNGSFTLAVSNLRAELPTLERPGSGQVTRPTNPRAGAGGKKSCARRALVRRVKVRPRGRRGLRFVLPRSGRFRIAVMRRQRATRSRAATNRRVVRFRNRTRSFTWRGRRGRQTGRYVVRVRANGSTARFRLKRRDGRFRVTARPRQTPRCAAKKSR